MDTSEEYIKMCNCPEIQGGKTFLPAFSQGNKFIFDIDGSLWCSSQIWLPRQDELQEMILSKEEGWFITFDFDYGENYKFTYNKEIRSAKETRNIRSDFYFDTLEKCYLALVMKEKHSAIWTGSEWEHRTKEETKELEGSSNLEEIGGLSDAKGSYYNLHGVFYKFQELLNK